MNTRAPCPLRISPLYILVVVYVFGVVAEYNDIDMFFIMSMSTQHSLSAKLTKQRAFPPDARAVFLQEDLFFEDLTVLSALRLEHRADSKVLLLSGRSARLAGAQNASVARFLYLKLSFCQDRLGTNIGSGAAADPLLEDSERMTREVSLYGCSRLRATVSRARWLHVCSRPQGAQLQRCGSSSAV